MNRDEKDTSRIRAITGPHNGCLPVKHVFTHRTCYRKEGQFTQGVHKLEGGIVPVTYKQKGIYKLNTTILEEQA